jgi:hypothetical protein
MGKPGPLCQVCGHAQRHLVELGLVHRVPVRVLAKRFSLNKDAIFRHRRLHMSPQLVAAIAAAQRPSDIDLEQLQRSESEGLIGSLVAQRARLQLLSEAAFEQGAISAATTVERAITHSLELTSRLLGMIVQQHEVRSTSILVSPDYLRLRHSIINTLRPFPDAALAVSRALAELETEAAETIKESKRPLLLEASAQ